jgi:hypothetical protein
MTASRRAAAAVLAGLCLTGLAGPAAAAPPARHVLKLWFRAFIPATHPQLPTYFKTAANGLSVLEAPWQPQVGPIGALSGTCFTTDQRGFSTDPAKTARATASLTLVAQGRDLTLQESARDIGFTHNVDCRTGIELQPAKQADKATVTIGTVATNGFNKTLDLKISSPNPFYTVGGIPYAPRIDMTATLTYDGLFRKLKVAGEAGYFPAFEVLYSLDGGPVKSLQDIQIHQDSTALSLFDFGVGLNTRPYSAAIDLSK